MRSRDDWKSPIVDRWAPARKPAAWRQDESANGLGRVARKTAGRGVVHSIPDPAANVGAGPDSPRRDEAEVGAGAGRTETGTEAGTIQK